MTQPMSRDEMVARAKELFGEEARVYYNDGWIIETQIEERFDEEEYKDRAAWEMYENGELERWSWKNGHSGESLAEIFDSYDHESEIAFRHNLAQVRQKIAEGFDFEGTGLEDYRDRVLAYAKEKGW